MKQTILLFIPLFLAGCTGEKNENRTTTIQAQTPPAEIIPENLPAETDLSVIVPDDLYLNGTLVLPPQNFASVTLIMGGTVHSTHLLPGEYVKKGTTLALLENIEFINLQQTYLEATAQTEYLEAEYNRQKRLSNQEAVSRKRFEESKAEFLSMKSKKEAAEAQLRMLDISPEELEREGIRPYLPVKAPITGYITGMKLNIGKYFQAGESMCEIVDKGKVMLNLTVYEKDLPYLTTGEQVNFVVNGINNNFTATLFSIGQEVDPSSRSLEVYARVEGTHPLFRPGMYVTAQANKK
ncbi:MAG: efflux RND transporter periplasmic adaptor subunit [Tannerellaceae bacterium]|nr:efflux RND transporter periplasmic adaptor subunit [Tannerellaceae bacterium]